MPPIGASSAGNGFAINKNINNACSFIQNHLLSSCINGIGTTIIGYSEKIYNEFPARGNTLYYIFHFPVVGLQ